MTRLQLYEDGILIFDRPGTVTPPQPGETCEQFISRMYSTYAHTTPDEGGYNWWVEQCRTGAQSRAQIEAAFVAAYPPAPTPPGGDPSAIVPPFQPWNLIQVIKQPSGHIAAYPIPAEAGLFTQGAMGQGHTPGACKTEYQISPLPGVLDAPQFTSHNTAYNGLEVRGYAGQYMNVRWTYPEGNGLGFSIQWAL